MPYLIEATGYSDTAGGTVVYRWSTGVRGYTSGPRDFPANTTWQPRIINPGTYERHCFGRGSIRGRSTVGYGEMVINNADGALDGLLDDVGFAGWPLTIRRGPKGGRYPDDFPVILTGTVAGVEFSRRRITFRLRDRQAVIADKMMVTQTYGGTNSGGSGLDGTEADIKGRYKAQSWGPTRNITLTWVNTSKLIALVAANVTGHTVSIDSIEDRGAVIAPDATPTYATIADLQNDALAPAANRRKTYTGPEGIFVRFGSTPNGEPTATITEGNTAAYRTRGRLAERILTGPGGEVEVRGVGTLDRQTAAVAGVFAGPDGLKVGDALDQLLSDGIWWLPARDGYIHLGLLEAPAGTPVAEFGRWNILNDGEALERITGDGEGLPLHATKVEHRKNWTVQDENALADIAVSERLWRALEYRVTDPVQADEVIRKYRILENAEPLAIRTLLDDPADAVTERNRIIARDRIRRDIYAFKVFSPEALDVDPADPDKNLIRITIPRFDLTAGKLFRCIGMIEDLSRNVSTIYAWG